MTVLVLVRRFLVDYARNPVNVLVLVLVPTVFVLVASGALADAARLLGGAGTATDLETVTAGWAAGFVSGIGMYFQIAGNRETDRRLVISGLARRDLIASRLATGLVLAVVATAAACAALVIRVGAIDTGRVVVGTFMFALIYVAIGATVGATVSNAVNGTVLILFIWILDVFFGPTLSASTSVVTRVLPTHFVSLWMADLPTGHAGIPTPLGWALGWACLALMVSIMVLAQTTRIVPGRIRKPSRIRVHKFSGLMRLGIISWRRNTVLWVLLILVPAVFVLLSDAITPPGEMTIVLREAGATVAAIVDPAHIHAGTMAPSGVASLAALAGMFIVLDNRRADRRLVMCGMTLRSVASARLLTVILASALAATSSLIFTALVFTPHNWLIYGIATLIIAMTYGCIGILLGPIFGRVSGVLVAFMIPFLDLGVGQSPMLRPEPEWWAQWLPGFGGMRTLIDGALTPEFDEWRSFLIALAWLAAAVGVSAWTLASSARAHSHASSYQRWATRTGGP